MEEIVVKELSVKYGKSQTLIEGLFYETRKKGFNVFETINIIEEFYIENLPTFFPL